MTYIHTKEKPRLLLLIVASLLITLAIYVTNSNIRTVHNYHRHSKTYEDLVQEQYDQDYSKLVNISFSFTHLPLVCVNKTPQFIVAVFTSPDNFERRQTIRETWGKNTTLVKILFMIGLVNDKATYDKIKKENETNGDFVQGNFFDSYFNLTYKHVMVLKYMIYHCPIAQYLVKVDDDTFVNMPNMKTFIHLHAMKNKNPTNILGERRYGHPVLRDGKWAVSVEEYPNSTYPNHCPGFAIIYPRAVVLKLHSEAQKNTFFWIDDVHVTGTLAKKSNISHTGIEELILTKEEVDHMVENNQTNINKPFLFGYRNLNSFQIRSLWSSIINHTPRASILEYLH